MEYRGPLALRPFWDISLSTTMTVPDHPSHPVTWLIRGRINPTYRDSEKKREKLGGKWSLSESGLQGAQWSKPTRFMNKTDNRRYL